MRTITVCSVLLLACLIISGCSSVKGFGLSPIVKAKTVEESTKAQEKVIEQLVTRAGLKEKPRAFAAFGTEMTRMRQRGV